MHSLIGKERLSVLSRAACDVWGLVPIGSGDEIERAKEMFSVSDCVVLDTCCQQFGGSGKVHDWDMSADIRTIYPDRRVSLSGGLCPENVIEAIKKVHPDIVDISSGVEREGAKDRTRINDLIGKVRNAE